MIDYSPYFRWVLLVIPIFLYAEIHYRIWNLFSRYFKREPEIIADVPHRLGPGKRLPVFICVKDANRFPIHLHSVSVKSGESILLTQDFNGEYISEKWWYKTLQCDVHGSSGTLDIDVIFSYTCRGVKKQCINDNYKLTSHRPFTVFVDEVPRPTLPGWVLGDMHTHSHLSDDQVEFGAPFDVTASMARAVELDFFASADHSYDLDDRVENYLVNDPELPKWKEMWRQIASFNQKNNDLKIIPGEELSAGNAKNQNVHFLIFHNVKFWQGWGDSAERWFRTRPQHLIPEVLAQLENEALAFAAHPVIQPPFVQKLLIRRGIWTDADLTAPGLNGAQFWNGDKEHFLNIGVQKWINLLLTGHKITLIAGTDAHGNFNRFRQIGTPHVSMREEQTEIFGTSVTGVKIDGDLTLPSILAGLKAGRVIVTDGPVAEMSCQLSATGFQPASGREDAKFEMTKVKNGRQISASDTQMDNIEKSFYVGDSIHSAPRSLHVSAVSSRSYGVLSRAEIILGDLSTKKETRKRIDLSSGLYEISKNIELEHCPQPGYIRLEVESRIGDSSFHCFTNPIYVD